MVCSPTLLSSPFGQKIQNPLSLYQLSVN
ncbi:MAG: hypothetical protein ACI8WB_002513, partial [Phenylobacterium sp.]